MLHRLSRNSSTLAQILAIAALVCLAAPVHSQSGISTPVLDEIVVTATRVETNLQQTPISVHALTGDELEQSGIDTGRDLGIMVPNVVINSGRAGERQPTMIFRGLPGVTTYFDGFWAGDWGFLQRSFVELERVEVLRGPQGTLFGRNTNGGAIQLITRPPADELGARVGAELGEFERRAVKVAVDAPVTDRIKTKWTAASDESEGFLDSRAGPFSFGDQDDSLLRGDVLWEPTDRFALRATFNDEKRHSSDARIVRIHNLNNQNYIAYNVLAGNPEYLAAARAVDPGFPAPPLTLPFDRFTPETHEPGFSGGTLGQWETRSNTPGPTTIADQEFGTLTLDWEISDRWSLESLTMYSRADFRQVQDADSSEFTFVTQTVSTEFTMATQEVHFLGNHFDGRLQSLLGLWYIELEGWDRLYQWAFWEFAIPNTGPNLGLPGPPGTGGRPAWNTVAVGYVHAWGTTVGNGAVAGYQPSTFLTTDALTYNERSEPAIFGEFTIGVLDRLDVTLGFRYTGDDSGSFVQYVPVEAFRPLEPGTMGAGDLYAPGAVVVAQDVPDLGTISTPRVSIAYEPRDTVYLYASYAEGFTQGEVRANPNGGPPIVLDPEVVRTREIGLRSDWLGRRLRLNATYFDSRWDGVRVVKEVIDPSTGQPFPFPISSSDGVADVDGLELELFYLPGERWELDLALGFLDAEYVDIGTPPANGTGLQPGIPLPYAPDTSLSIGVKYRWPLANGTELLFVGNYGWMDEYERATANQEQTKNPDGSHKPEPAYGVVNARVVLELDDGAWQVSLFGTNLTDEWYVNGGNDFGFLFGFDRATIGRPREVGVGFEYRLGP
jgi:iron complex outermembrane receptor protein